MKITYAKLHSGAWGIRGAGLVEGAVVTVTKRDGSTKTETVDKVVWRGSDGACLASIVTTARPAAAGAGNRGYRGGCKGCGGPIVNAPHHRAMDGYCGTCAFDEFDC